MRDRTRRLLDLVLAVNAVGFGAIGLIALVTPQPFAALADIELTTAAARAEYSAVHAGLHLAFAAVMVGALAIVVVGAAWWVADAHGWSRRISRPTSRSRTDS